MTREVIGGSANHFGPRDSEMDLPLSNAEEVMVRTIIVPLRSVASVASLIATQSALDAADLVIPAKSMLVRAYLNVKTAFTATTAVSITVGIDGNADALITAAGKGAKAGLVADSWHIADGDGLGLTVGASDVHVVAAWNAADATSLGNALLVIEYMPPQTHIL